jgi:adenylate cyclase
MNYKSIAILPFLNLNSDSENEYFSDGITEELINALTSIKGLKVTARTSSFAFKGKQMDVRHIGNELGVSTILEGSVRKSKNRVRISTQLVRTDDGFQIWSSRFDRELVDIFELQDEISREIAEKLRENFGHFEIEERLIDAPTQNIEAYNLYLKARFHHLKWDGDGINTAIEYYQQSIDLAPDFSWPYFGIGYCYAMAGSWGSAPELLELSYQHIEKGFSLDSNSFLGYYSKATLAFWGYWDFKGGYELYRKAIALNPAYTEAEEGLIELLVAIGDYENAIHHAKNILKIDPLSKNHFFTIAHTFYFMEEYDQAEKYFNESLKLDIEFTHSIGRLLTCYIMMNNRIAFDEFIEGKKLYVQPQVFELLFDLVNVEGFTPDSKMLESLLKSLEEPISLLPWQLIISTQTGDIELANTLLEKAISSKQGQIMNFARMPLLKPLRNTERFQKLVEQVHGSGQYPISSSEVVVNETGSKPLMSDEEIKLASSTLHTLMNEQHVYLTSTLSLKELAEQVDTHPNKLSWLLNEVFELSFNDYVNNFRLKCFQDKALQEDSKNYTLLGLAFESGFNSKSTFNDFFKKKTGMTPRSWLKQQ